MGFFKDNSLDEKNESVSFVRCSAPAVLLCCRPSNFFAIFSKFSNFFLSKMGPMTNLAFFSGERAFNSSSYELSNHVLISPFPILPTGSPFIHRSDIILLPCSRTSSLALRLVTARSECPRYHFSSRLTHSVLSCAIPMAGTRYGTEQDRCCWTRRLLNKSCLWATVACAGSPKLTATLNIKSWSLLPEAKKIWSM